MDADCQTQAVTKLPTTYTEKLIQSNSSRSRPTYGAYVAEVEIFIQDIETMHIVPYL